MHNFDLCISDFTALQYICKYPTHDNQVDILNLLKISPKDQVAGINRNKSTLDIFLSL